MEYSVFLISGVDLLSIGRRNINFGLYVIFHVFSEPPWQNCKNDQAISPFLVCDSKTLFVMVVFE